MTDWLDSEEFYNLMQAYRHHRPVTNELELIRRFEAVQDFIRLHMPPAMTGPVDALERVLELESELERLRAGLREALAGWMACAKRDTAEMSRTMFKYNELELLAGKGGGDG